MVWMMTSSSFGRNTSSFFFFFFNDTATTEIYTLSLHDALPSWPPGARRAGCQAGPSPCSATSAAWPARSEEHTSELQSHHDIVCRLLLAKKNSHLYCCLAVCTHSWRFFPAAALSSGKNTFSTDWPTNSLTL